MWKLLGALLCFKLSFISFTAELIGKEDCFSCEISVNSLEEPIDLSGKWLFTKDDSPSNASGFSNLDSWTRLGTPGPWSKAYGDGKNFNVGWYKGKFVFNEDLIGSKATFYIDAYMSKIDIYLDGKKIYYRDGKHTHATYRSIQPIPVNFEIQSKEHIIAFRVETRLMTGVYQSPFQLRQYKRHDPFINFMEIFSGELRYLFAYTFVWTGLFFLALYTKTKYSLYLVSALTGIGIYPFYAMPNDITLRWVDPDLALVLHYPGLGFMSLGYFLFSQYFHKFYKKTTYVYSATVILFTAAFLTLAVNFNMDVFQVCRKALFFVAFSIATHGLINCLHALKKDRRIFIVIVGQALFWVSAGHDILLALGLIRSTALIFIGTFAGIFSIMLVTVNLFGETFLENKKLLKEIEANNALLETKVEQRTNELKVKSIEMSTILNSLPEAVLKIDQDLRVESSFSHAAEEVLKTSNIDGGDVIDLVFGTAQLSEDAKSSIRAALDMSLGDYHWTFEANLSTLPMEIARKVGDEIQHISLGWNTICNDDDEVERIVLTLSDITEIKKDHSKTAYWQLKSTVFNAFLEGEISKYQKLVNKGQLELDKYASKEADWTETTGFQRELHTIKGNSRVLKLNHLSELCHETESLLGGSKTKSSPNTQELDISVHKITSHLGEVKDLIEEVSTKLDSSDLSSRQTLSEKKLLFDIESAIREDNSNDALHYIKQIRYHSADNLISSLPEQYRPTAEKLGKPDIKFNIHCDKDLKLEPYFMSDLEDALGHLIRNSLDHGIEPHPERQTSGKELAGNIHVSIEEKDGALLIQYWDDGRGIDINKLISKGHSQDLQFDDTDYLQVKNLVFLNSFSTADVVTEISGRGVGMDVVSHFCENWRGKISWIPPQNADDTRHPFSLSFVFPIELAIKLDIENPVQQNTDLKQKGA